MARVYLIGVVALVACVAGCGNSAESAVAGILAKKKELVGVLKGVTDKTSADAAKPKIQAIMDDVKRLESKIGGNSDREGMAIALVKYRAEMDDVQQAFQAELTRIDKIPATRDVIAETMVGFAGTWLTGVDSKP